MRFFDIFLSLSAIILLSPLLLFTAILLKFTGEGEILFYQKRIGAYGKPFSIIKFATMLKDSPQIGAGSITVKNDPRILPLGRMLRKTKINELPQLFNILKGDMSFVGPRPHVERDLLGVEEKVKNKTLSVRPGLSGIGSIVFRDEEVLLHQHNNPREFYDVVIAPYKAKLEIWYVENRSLVLYLILIFITVFVVISKRSLVIFKFFPSLPQMPVEISKYL